jgi:hypothetical protein
MAMPLTVTTVFCGVFCGVFCDPSCACAAPQGLPIKAIPKLTVKAALLIINRSCIKLFLHPSRCILKPKAVFNKWFCVQQSDV